MDIMDIYYAFLSNKIIKALSGFGSALLKLYGIQDDTTGEISFYCEGKKNDMPTICKDMEGKNIDDLCAGLRKALREEGD